MSLVSKIKDLCTIQGTTLIGLERMIGLGRGTIRNWDTNNPSIDKLQKVADYFDVSTDYLIGRTNIKRPITSKQVFDEELFKLLKKHGIMNDMDEKLTKEQLKFITNLLGKALDLYNT